jgi:hypothetical protein
MAKKDYKVGIDIKKVNSVNISRYADGYNYASISSRISDNEFMNINYEWKGKTIPEFALNAMEIMKALGMEKAGVIEGQEEEYALQMDRAAKYFTELSAKFTKKDVDMEDEDDDMKKKKKKKEGKKKKDC